jgi:hypothetical protein
MLAFAGLQPREKGAQEEKSAWRLAHQPQPSDRSVPCRRSRLDYPGTYRGQHIPGSPCAVQTIPLQRAWPRRDTCSPRNRAPPRRKHTDTPSDCIPPIEEGWIAEEALAVAVFCSLRALSPCPSPRRWHLSEHCPPRTVPRGRKCLAL